MSRLWSNLAFCVLAIAPSARADWVVLGAAYQCVPGESFELRATVDTSSPEDLGTVQRPPGFIALKQDQPSRLRCAIGEIKVEALIQVWGPKATGVCAGSGDVAVESLLVNGKSPLEADESFGMSCTGGPAITSVRVQGGHVRVCRGEWDWGKGFHSVKCSSAGA